MPSSTMPSLTTQESDYDEQPQKKKQRIIYHCAVCDQHFTEKRTFLRHCREAKSHLEKLQIENPKRLRCHECGRAFARAYDLQRHSAEVHAGQRIRFGESNSNFDDRAVSSESNNNHQYNEQSSIENSAVSTLLEVDNDSVSCRNTCSKPDSTQCGSSLNHSGDLMETMGQLSVSPTGKLEARINFSEVSVDGSPISAEAGIGPIEEFTSNCHEENVEDEHAGEEQLAASGFHSSTPHEDDALDGLIASAFEDLCMNDTVGAKSQAGATCKSGPITLEKCVVCHTCYSDSASLIDCMLDHLQHPLRPYVCDKCDFGFVRRDHLDHHLRQAIERRHCGFHFPHKCEGHHLSTNDSPGSDNVRHQMELWYFTQQCLKTQKSALKLKKAEPEPVAASRWSLDIIRRSASKVSRTSSLNTRWTAPSVRMSADGAEFRSLQQGRKLGDLIASLRKPERDHHQLQREIQLYDVILHNRIEDLKSLNLEGQDLAVSVRRNPPLIPVDFNPLILALKLGNPEVIEYLLDRGASADLESLRKVLPCKATLAAAVEANSLVSLHALINSGLDIHGLDQRGISLLHFACTARDPSILRFLLARSANPNEVSKKFETPLLRILSGQTIGFNTTDALKVQILLEHGANPNLVVNGRSPLIELLNIASQSSRYRSGNLTSAFSLGQALIQLLQHGAELSHAEMDTIIRERMILSSYPVELATFDSVWCYAMLARSIRGVPFLDNTLSHWGSGYAAFDSYNFAHFKPTELGEILCLAAKFRDVRLAEFLIQNGAPVDHSGYSGPPLLIATEAHDDEMIRILLKKGPNPAVPYAELPDTVPWTYLPLPVRRAGLPPPVPLEELPELPFFTCAELLPSVPLVELPGLSLFPCAELPSSVPVQVPSP